ncbi:DegV family protein [Aquimonas sp.]|jgi:DegV family protein with EDD domain|uniref:DegV family protein n=1 Tax=Aquimonas sp. TaxID=1872588 RepID=UPI0037BF107A
MVAVLNPRALAAPVTAAQLRRALIAGMRRVIERRELLDRINVFPVADGDTGSNLAFTLNSVLCGALSKRCASVGQLLRGVAEDAVDGARGNSGAIFAQFLSGLSQRVADARVLPPAELAEAADAGASAARSALSEPREGTIISVIRAFADAMLRSTRGGGHDVRESFESALDQARRALADTPRQLAVLRQAGVVDAGAQGFVDLLEGIHDYLCTGRLRVQRRAEHLDDVPFVGADIHDEVSPEHRWCTECLLSGDSIDHAELRSRLAALGADSVVIAGTASRLRIHAHVAEPAQMFELAGDFGVVSAHKAEDMLVQQYEAGLQQAVAVVTDSGADLPAALASALGLSSVPVRVSFGDQEFLDKVSISAAEFHRRLKSSTVAPKTSQPPLGDFRRQFETRLSHHREVVYVGISRALSGTLQAGETAAARVSAERISVADSGHASCGQALLALAAAQAARDGASAAEVVATVAALRPRVQTWAMTRDVSFAVRGGRIPAWAGRLVAGLGLTPVARAKPNGRLGVVGALSGGPKAATERFARHLLRRLDRRHRWRVLVGHVDCREDGERLLSLLTAALQVDSLGVVEVGPAIGAHAGTGALVVGLMDLGPH